MASARAFRADQNDRIRSIVREIVAKEGGQTDAAKALGVGRHLVTQHLLGKGAGQLLIDALRAYTGRTYEDIVDGSEPVVLPERRTERDDRYPNRAKAIIAWRALERDEAVVSQILQLNMQRAEDASAEEWFADMEREERLMKKPPKPPVLVSEAAAGGDADTSWRR